MAQPLALESAPAGQQAGWRRNQDLIDALPYVDRLTPEEKQKVDALIAEEMKHSTQRPAAYLKDLPPAYKLNLDGHPVLQKELQRVREGGQMEGLDITRYQLNKPPLARRNDFSAWKKSLDNAYSQLGHQYNRVVNLELLLKFGPKAWRVQNTNLDACNIRLTKEVAELKGQIDAINRQRKLQQTAAGQELAQLEVVWQTLVAKNGEIERACRQVEEEIVLTQATASSEPKVAVETDASGDANANGGAGIAVVTEDAEGVDTAGPAVPAVASAEEDADATETTAMES